MNKLREYFEYKRNQRFVKREITKIMATTLPMLSKGSELISFIEKLLKATKEVEGKELIEIMLNEVSSVLQTDNARLIEIASYMSQLSREDIQKILVHSMVETIEK